MSLQAERAKIEENKEAIAEGTQTKKYIPAAVYVAVSLRAMQAIDFGWLVNRKFKYHHYRPPGHGDTPDADAPAPDEKEREGTAEFVYYCWPGEPEDDMVPSYRTSIEGATGLAFSPDMKKILLVWERGAWSTAGGAVNVGECKVETLKRELKEELDVTVDEHSEFFYLGGWSTGRARDNTSNDSFTMLAVRLASEYFKPDRKEIHQAQWFEWTPLLKQWREKGKDRHGRKVTDLDLGQKRGDPAILDPKADHGERNIIALSVMQALDMYAEGRTYKVKVDKLRLQAGEEPMKATWGAMSDERELWGAPVALAAEGHVAVG